MALYRLQLKLLSPLGTPLVGPSLFGQLCWIKRDADGDEELQKWLEDEEKIWRISDAFPCGYLPKPLCKPKHVNEVDQLQNHKERKKLIYIKREEWIKHRDKYNEDNLPIDSMTQNKTKQRRLAHNIIDRHKGGTLDEGGLFFTDEDWRFCSAEKLENSVDIYVQAQDDKEDIKRLFAILGDVGFGRDASTGRGRWQVENIEQDEELLHCSGNNVRYMTLTRGVLTPESMHDSLWKLEPHFGRLGPQLSLSGISPFKCPVLLMLPGASFTPADNVSPEKCGKWLTGIHPQREEVGLNGLHIAIPFSEQETAA